MPSIGQKQETIAIFGSTGKSGKEILAGALEKGYKVRLMVRNPAKLENSIKNNADVTVFTGNISSKDAIRDTIQGSQYVISVVSGPLGKPDQFPVGEFLAFTKTLVEIMKETPTVKVFLHQAGAFVPHPDGSHPLLLRMLKKYAEHPKLGGIGPNLAENLSIMKYMMSIQDDDDVKFKMIATRPGKLDNSDKMVELIGDDTNYPMSTTSYYDLGRFTVDAIEDESLYGKFPFVVAKKSSGSLLTPEAMAISSIFLLAAFAFRRA